LAVASLLGLGAIATAGLSTGIMADRRAAAAEARYPPKGEFVDVDGRRIHYTISGTGPDVVLVHGAFGSLRDFTFDLVDRLDDTYRVIAVDRPGMGYSDHVHSRYARAFAPNGDSPMEQATLLAGAVRTLGVERPVVIGHSFGGAVAIAWALDHDPAALVLYAGVAMPWPDTLDLLYRATGTALGGALLAPLLSAWTPQARLESAARSTFAPQSPPDGYVDHIGAYMSIRLDAFRATTRQVNHLRPHIVAMADRYADLSLPVEILHGDADTTVPMNIHSGPFSEHVVSANLTVLTGVGHMPHHANPGAAVAAVDRAVARAGLR